VATIAILQHRTVHDALALADQLNVALNSRIVIEQAKGALGERLSLSMEDAFSRLRAHARNHNLRLVDVARGVLDGTVPADTLDQKPAPKPA